MSRDVYITGLGVVSPIGVGKRALLAGLRSGRIGSGKLRGLDAAEFRIGRGGEVDDDLLRDPSRPDRGRGFALALLACREALADAGLDPVPEGMTLALGSGAGEMRAMETTMGSPEDALPLDHADPIRPPSTITSKLAHDLGSNGRMLTFVNACAAGAQAIAVAAEAVRSGRTEVALAGGVEVLSRMVMSGFESLRAISQTGCRPFDVDRDGIDLSEVAAFVVLEAGQRLEERGRTGQAYARIAGSGSSADAFHTVRPAENGAGAVLALRRALDDAGLTPEAIDYVNAHGTGTRQNDPVELAALAEVFGSRITSIPISSTKAMLGHALGASGAVELVACALAISEGFLPPTMGWRRPIEGFETIDVVPNEARNGVALRHVVTSSFAFGGNNVVIVLSAAENADS